MEERPRPHHRSKMGTTWHICEEPEDAFFSSSRGGVIPGYNSWLQEDPHSCNVQSSTEDGKTLSFPLVTLKAVGGIALVCQFIL